MTEDIPSFFTWIPILALLSNYDQEICLIHVGTEGLKSALTDMGLDHIESLSAPADGISQFGFWTEPMAWDVKQAKLEIIEPAVAADQAVLADFEKVPT